MPSRPVRTVIENHDFVTVTGDTTVKQVAELMKSHHISAVLVTEGRYKALGGICTERDIVFDVVAAGLDPEVVQVDAIMTVDPQTISPDSPFGHALHLMYEGGFHHVPVVENGRPVGILCAKDALGLDALQFEIELVRREEIMVIL
jgi:CBS domain-containing protein